MACDVEGFMPFLMAAGGRLGNDRKTGPVAGLAGSLTIFPMLSGES